MNRVPAGCIFALLTALAAATPFVAANANGRSDRIEDELDSARLEMRDSEGWRFHPNSFIFAGPDGAYSAPAPREFDASRASGLPASRLPVIGGYFRRELVPPPDERGAPVYAIGDAMALDLRQFRPEDWSAAMQAAGGRRFFIISGGRLTVMAIQPFFRPFMFKPAPMPDFGRRQIGEAFIMDDALVIAPLARDFYGARPW